MNFLFWTVFAVVFTVMGYWAAHMYFKRKDRKKEASEFSDWLEKTAKDALEGK